MNKHRLGLFLLVTVAVALFCVAQQKTKTDSKQAPAKHEQVPFKPSADFARLKTLVGRWEGTSAEGPVVSTFRVTADGSAIMNMVAPDTPYEMLTVFHPDGANIMGTHYCSGHNQPRFVAEPAKDPKVLEFKFKDITNLSQPEAGHIEGLIITFIDADHHTEEWIYRENGKVSQTTFELARKK
jgi:hypothetical protein